MNTGDYTNQLKALMDFYDSTGAGGPRDGGMGMNQANYAGDRLRFAQSALQGLNGPSFQMQQPPNFFAGFNDQRGPNPQYPQYSANEPVPANVIAQKQGFPLQPGTQPQGLPQRPSNYLMSLFGH